MSNFAFVADEWVTAELAANQLGIDPVEVKELAGTHRLSRRKLNGVWTYNMNYLRRKLDTNP